MKYLIQIGIVLRLPLQGEERVLLNSRKTLTMDHRARQTLIRRSQNQVELNLKIHPRIISSEMVVLSASPSPRRPKRFVNKRNLFVTEGGDISVTDDNNATLGTADDAEMVFLESPLVLPPDDIQTTMEKLKLEKLKLEVEKERVALYKLRLETLKLEKELHLPRSTHTNSLKVIEIPH